MNSNTSPDTPQHTSTTGQNTLPDTERRKLLKRLGVAAVMVPAVTLLHDATMNVANAGSVN